MPILRQMFQHEFDHLQGVIFIDHVKSTLDLGTEREYARSI